MLKNKKWLLIAISIILLIAVIVVVLVIISNKEKPEEIEENEENVDTEQLEIDFNGIFDNIGNEYISTMYAIKEDESGKFKIEANIPYIYTSNEFDITINREINDIFIKKLMEVYNESEIYTIFKIDYSASISDNMLSLVIRCVLKEGSNAQRTIIKTYNYDIENNESIDIMGIIPEEKKDEIQEQINEKIQNEIKKENTIIEQGYDVYKRDEDSDIYILENVTEFYVKDNVLYIIYSYGNNNYTSEVDTIIVAL